MKLIIENAIDNDFIQKNNVVVTDGRYPFFDANKIPKYNLVSWLPNKLINKETKKSWLSLQTICPDTDFKCIEEFKFKDSDNDKFKLPKFKSIHLRLKPNKIQKDILKNWAGCYRFTYNKSVASIKNNKDTMTPYTNLKLRNRFVTAKSNNVSREDQKSKKKLGKVNNFFNNKKWLLECPKEIRKNACDSACVAFKAAITNLKEKNITNFNISYCSKKQQDANGFALNIPKESIKLKNSKLTIFTKTLGEIKYCSRKQYNKIFNITKENLGEIKADCKIFKNKFGEYYLSVPIPIKKIEKTKGNNLVSIDPGERKMLTTYSPNKNESLLIGANYRDIILPLLEKLDSLYSKEALLKNEKKSTKNIKQKILLLRKYIHNLKCESVNQVSNLITKSYDKIVMPKLDVINLTERAERKLKTKIVRSMLSMRHCELFDKIKFKSHERGKEFMKVKEDYTSQTCFKCGDLKKSSLEIKSCNKCSLSYDRDIVGALNILLKSIR